MAIGTALLVGLCLLTISKSASSTRREERDEDTTHRQSAVVAPRFLSTNSNIDVGSVLAPEVEMGMESAVTPMHPASYTTGDSNALFAVSSEPSTIPDKPVSAAVTADYSQADSAAAEESKNERGVWKTPLSQRRARQIVRERSIQLSVEADRQAEEIFWKSATVVPPPPVAAAASVARSRNEVIHERSIQKSVEADCQVENIFWKSAATEKSKNDEGVRKTPLSQRKARQIVRERSIQLSVEADRQAEDIFWKSAHNSSWGVSSMGTGAALKHRSTPNKGGFSPLPSAQEQEQRGLTTLRQGEKVNTVDSLLHFVTPKPTLRSGSPRREDSKGSSSAPRNRESRAKGKERGIGRSDTLPTSRRGSGRVKDEEFSGGEPLRSRKGLTKNTKESSGRGEAPLSSMGASSDSLLPKPEPNNPRREKDSTHRPGSSGVPLEGSDNPHRSKQADTTPAGGAHLPISRVISGGVGNGVPVESPSPPVRRGASVTYSSPKQQQRQLLLHRVRSMSPGRGLRSPWQTQRSMSFSRSGMARTPRRRRSHVAGESGGEGREERRLVPELHRTLSSSKKKTSAQVHSGRFDSSRADWSAEGDVGWSRHKEGGTMRGHRGGAS